MRPATRLLISVVAGIAAVLLMGGFALSLAGSYSAQRNKAIEKFGGETVDVLVAKNDIKPGATVTSEMVETRKWVADLLPSDALTDVEQLKKAKANSLIQAGQPISSRRLGESESGVIAVPSGLTAISIPIQAVTAVGGAVRGGNTVTIAVADGTNEPYILAEDVLVLATSNDSMSSASDGPFPSSSSGADLQWVTLAVEPTMVLPVVNVSEGARVHLVMKGEGAVSQEGTKPAEQAPNP